MFTKNNTASFSFPWLSRGDSAIPVDIEIRNDEGEPYVLTGKTVTMKAQKINAAAVKISSACTVVSATEGIVRYTFSSADLDTAGVFDAELEMTSSGFKETIVLGRFQVVEDLPK
jgi:hypothetical protein